MLSLLHHPNLVNLIGYCADRDQRLLVYEFMPLGSLENHLHGISFPCYYKDKHSILTRIGTVIVEKLQKCVNLDKNQIYG